MKIALDYQNVSSKKISSYKKKFLEIANFTLTKLNKNKNYNLSVTICDMDMIQEYNKSYRNIDKVTDVLSFAFLEADDLSYIEDMEISLGDILICYQRALEQSIEYQHSIDREMCFLFLHGLLHLLGYDHMKEEDEKIMFALQEEILNELDIKRS